MNPIFCRPIPLLVLIHLLLIQSLPVSGQSNFPGGIHINITQNAQVGGTVDYTIRSFIFGGAAAPKILSAPDGTQFGSGPSLGNIQTVPSFAELSSRFFGTWKLLEDLPLPSQVDSTYNFTFNALTLNEVFHETPIIISPTDGTIVPNSFVIEWAYPSGAMPTSRAMFHSGGTADIEFDTTFTSRAFVKFALPLSGPISATFRAGSHANLASYLSVVTLLSGPQRSNYSVQAGFTNLSLPITVTVVPEPSTILGLVCSGFLLCTQRIL